MKLEIRFQERSLMETSHIMEAWDRWEGMVVKGGEEWLWGVVVEGY